MFDEKKGQNVPTLMPGGFVFRGIELAHGEHYDGDEVFALAHRSEDKTPKKADGKTPITAKDMVQKWVNMGWVTCKGLDPAAPGRRVRVKAPPADSAKDEKKAA